MAMIDSHTDHTHFMTMIDSHTDHTHFMAMIGWLIFQPSLTPRVSRAEPGMDGAYKKKAERTEETKEERGEECLSQ